MFAGRHVLVVGAGVTGKSVVAALLDLGARVTVTATDPAADLSGLPHGVETVPGLTVPPDGVDLVVTSPGLPPTTPLLANAGVEVIGEVELAWRIGQTLPTPPAWLAVTGTDGKTTTVGMLESILLASGAKAVACGNIGLPVIDAVLGGYDVLAVELSSYQLHWQSSMRAHAAVELNIAEDHLEWHGSMAAYVQDKGRIYTGAGLAVYNADDVETERLAAGAPATVSFTLGPPGLGQYGVVNDSLVHGDQLLARVAEVRPIGPHNVANALAAAALARAYGVPPEAVRAGLTAFTPPPHRVELIAEHDGVRYINDSKATNTHSAQGSLGAFEKVVWIAGGLLHGAAATALARHAPDVPVHRVGSGDDEPMLTAVRAANAMATPGDVVLLAPAAKSHDLFASYVHRGTAFAEAVRDVLAERG
jgi:UDP-N-acetylmuramoylalanine--D-glutamate ligase